MSGINRREFISKVSGAGLASLSLTARPGSELLALGPDSADREAGQMGAAVKGAYQYTGNVEFDLSRVPFSRFGSYMAFAHLAAEDGFTEGLYLRTLHGEVSQRRVFRLELLDERYPIPFKEIATPTVLRLKADKGEVEICLAEPKVVRIRGRGVGLRLTAPQQSKAFAYALVYEYAIPMEKSQWEVNSFTQRANYMVTSLKGTAVVDAPWEGTRSEHIVIDFMPDPASGTFEAALEEYDNSWNPHSYPNSFDAAHKVLEDEYHSWLGKTLLVPEDLGPTAELAAYVNWESVVAPEGHLTRPAMLMSKNWMTNIWSWDHCFNAMALILKDPDLAWDQFRIILENQNKYGAFPDLMNDQTREWNFTKPPVHGWALHWMMKRSPWIDNKRLAEVYEPLARWTDWFFKYRDVDHDGLPEYNHGNDSGWDNATVFLMRTPLETPDLSAFLVIQMDVLAGVARRLGKSGDAAKWKQHADALLKLMLAKLWRQDHFVALQSGTHDVDDCDSLLLHLPIVLGNRLPAAVREKMIAGLTRAERFMTEYGLASESLRSPYYEPDGYWRGPIWAPSTMIIAEGLDSAGDHVLAHELRVKFCRVVEKSGMSENFDAITGKPWHDPAYTWTSSVFLIFANQLLERQA